MSESDVLNEAQRVYMRWAKSEGKEADLDDPLAIAFQDGYVMGHRAQGWLTVDGDRPLSKQELLARLDEEAAEYERNHPLRALLTAYKAQLSEERGK